LKVGLCQQFISLLREELVEELANKLGLVRVGWIFTDLVPLANGKVRNKLYLFFDLVHNADSDFVSINVADP
jgi:hypothetical protein